jgi:hypothetical protein
MSIPEMSRKRAAGALREYLRGLSRQMTHLGYDTMSRAAEQTENITQRRASRMVR